MFWESILREVLSAVYTEIRDINYLIRNRMKPSYFVRSTGKYSFYQLVEFILHENMKALGLSFSWFRSYESIHDVCYSTIGQTRQKISYHAFSELNGLFLSIVRKRMKQTEFELYEMQDYSLNLLSTERTQEAFGRIPAKDRTFVKSHTAVLFDSINGFILDGKMDKNDAKSRDIAGNILNEYSSFNREKTILYFGSHFYSHSFLKYLKMNKFNFVIKTNWENLKSIHNIDENGYGVLRREGTVIPFRVLEVVGTESNSVLITNAEKLLNASLILNAYSKVWMGSKFNTERMNLKQFVGNSPIAILQDFYAAMFLYNVDILVKKVDAERSKNEDN